MAFAVGSPLAPQEDAGPDATDDADFGRQDPLATWEDADLGSSAQENDDFGSVPLLASQEDAHDSLDQENAELGIVAPIVIEEYDDLVGLGSAVSSES